MSRGSIFEIPRGLHNCCQCEAYVRSRLGGKAQPSLLNLKQLSHLDLSNNDFGGVPIPSFIGSFKSLRYLNLSYAGFGGVIPHQLGNLSSLQYLDLIGYFEGLIPHQLGNLSSLRYLKLRGGFVENLQWLYGHSLLQHIDLSYVNLTRASDWLQVTNMLPSLVELSLSACSLDHFPALPAVNFTSLATLDLSFNYFQSFSIPDWLLIGLKGLDSLNLQFCGLHGPISSGVRNMTFLRNLILSYNLFNSTIPDWLYGFSHLEYLNLSFNDLQGVISSAIGNLTSLTTLTSHLIRTQLSGHFPDATRQLRQSKNLEALFLSSCFVFDHIPLALGELLTLQYLDISNNSLSGHIPMSLGRSSSLKYLYLSGNNLSGPVPETLGQLANLEVFSMCENSLQGVISEVHFANLTRLREFIGGFISHFLCYKMEQPKDLELLNLEGNLLSGEIPDCWMSWFGLEFLSLRNNNLTELTVMDFGENKFSGSIPAWIGERLVNLKILILRSNKFHSNIPKELCALFSLQILDLANNNLWGSIPKCLMNISAMGMKLD
ncbi:LRR receptor-like serine/threonine-protein kinase SIK1 [Cornus florida]|uniref:LRR receptor-like serine/threonine-protein kinase SIK1 n=1 Tax=Cornus florida TaxID=4283 RepID=UPI002897FF85|nr:LRR receptor-like serine/threonine-protein kinase SIK1 [Cornus florida]